MACMGSLTQTGEGAGISSYVHVRLSSNMLWENGTPIFQIRSRSFGYKYSFCGSFYTVGWQSWGHGPARTWPSQAGTDEGTGTVQHTSAAIHTACIHALGKRCCPHVITFLTLSPPKKWCPWSNSLTNSLTGRSNQPKRSIFWNSA